MAIVSIIAPTPSVILSGNPMFYQVTTNTTLTSILRLNATILARANVSDSWETITTLQLTYSPFNATTVFDIRSIVSNLLDVSELPAPSTDWVNSVHSKQIKLSLFETNLGSETPLDDATETDPFWCIKGITDFIKASDASNYNYQEAFTAKFLTEMPKTRDAYFSQPFCVSFANLSLAGTAVTYILRVFIFWENGEDDLIQETIELDFGKIKTFVCDDSLFDIPAGPPQRVKKVQVKLFSDADVQLDALTFNYREAPAKRSRHFIWLNNLGGYDFLTCTGLLEQKLKSEGTIIATTVYQNDYTSQQADNIEVNFRSDTSYKINTGMLTRAEVDAFLHFFASPQSFLFAKNGLENTDFWYLPVSKKLSASFRKDRNYENAVSFEFQTLFNPKTSFPIN